MSELRRCITAPLLILSIVSGLISIGTPAFAGCLTTNINDCVPKGLPKAPDLTKLRPPPIDPRIFDPLHPPSPAQVVQIVADALNSLQSQVLTGPLLANAIKASRASAYGQAIPIPQEIRWALVGYASQDSLDRVRFKVGDNGFANLARLIEQSGQASAVTLIDVIIFKGPTEASDPSLWAHELTHVDQYSQMGGADAFAAQYMQDHNVLEDPAYAVNSRRIVSPFSLGMLAPVALTVSVDRRRSAKPQHSAARSRRAPPSSHVRVRLGS